MHEVNTGQTRTLNSSTRNSRVATNEMARTRAPRRLLIVSQVLHYKHAGKLYAYGPYAREIDIWADLFPNVAIAAPCREQAPPGDCLAFTRSNISIRPQLETGGKTRQAKAKQVLLLPAHLWRLSGAMREADAIHVRFPASLGLLGALLAPLFSPYLVAKWAGQWNAYEGERFAIRVQRWLLRSRWWHGIVTVYGQWSNEPAHIISFFTSMMTAEQVKCAVEIARDKKITAPLRVLFSGRLAPEKRVDALLHAVKLASERNLDLELAVVGDGTEGETLRSLVTKLGIESKVKFIGALPFDESLKWYEWAHCLVLPSINSEGFPKVVAEAMCHGLICIAVNHGQVPTMLTGRGVLLEKGTPEEIAAAWQRIAAAPDEFQSLMHAASEWSRQYSLEGLRSALGKLLSEQWNVTLNFAEKTSVPSSIAKTD